MALNKIISSGVRIAHNLTKSLQVTCTHRAWTGIDTSGNFNRNTYAPATIFTAIVEQKLESRVDSTGKVIKTQAKLTIVQQIPANGSQGRTEPIDTRDIIVLPDGTTGPIWRPEGVLNPDNNRPYAIELWIGA